MFPETNNNRSSLHLPTRPSTAAPLLPKKTDNHNNPPSNSFPNNLSTSTANAVQGKGSGHHHRPHVSPNKNHTSSVSHRQEPSSSIASPPDQVSKNSSQVANKGLANSWATLTKSSQSSTKAPVAKDTFAAFKKQAKDKEDKQKMLQIQQEQRRMQKEQEEKERLRVERERQKDLEADDALDRVRRSQQQSMSPVEDFGTPSPSSQGSASPAQSLSERERLRKREQERRRREAQAGRIDMNRQSDIMANFEHENMG